MLLAQHLYVHCEGESRGEVTNSNITRHVYFVQYLSTDMVDKNRVCELVHVRQQYRKLHEMLLLLLKR